MNRMKPGHVDWEEFFRSGNDPEKGNGDSNALELAAWLKKGAALATLLMAVQALPEAQIIRQAIPALASEFKPWLQGMSEFSTRLDIAAIREMEAAGISQENAVMLRAHSTFYRMLGFEGRRVSKSAGNK